MNHSYMSDFAYVGGRSYIRGVDLLRQFLQSASMDTRTFPSEVISLKILRELKCNGVWCDDCTQAGDASRMGPSAALEYCDLQGEKKRLWFYETGLLITRSLPDSPAVVSSTSCDAPFSGRATITKPYDAMSVLEGLVAANKSLHASTLRDRGINSASIRFLYVERLPIITQLKSNEVEIKISHRGTKEMDGRIYTLNVADFDCNFGSARVIICFSFHRQG